MTTNLAEIEAEAVYVIREVAAEFERPVLLFSGGKDSIVMLHLAIKAFAPAKLPFPIMHVDTGHNFDEVIDYRDRTVARLGIQLIVASVQRSIDTGKWSGDRPALQSPRLQTAPCSTPSPSTASGSLRRMRRTRRRRVPKAVLLASREFGQGDPKNHVPNCGAVQLRLVRRDILSSRSIGRSSRVAILADENLGSLELLRPPPSRGRARHATGKTGSPRCPTGTEGMLYASALCDASARARCNRRRARSTW